MRFLISKLRAITLFFLLFSLLTGQTISYFGDYNSNGLPDYLASPGDNVSAGMINFIGNNVEEGQAVSNDLLTMTPEVNTFVVNSNVNISITFVSEGAGYQNALGYYTYSFDDPPTSPSEILDLEIIFPNVSDDVLSEGDKVDLGAFPAGTVVGWFLVSDGWDGTNQIVETAGHNVFYSNSNFNPNQKQQNILFSYNAEDKILLSFDDQPDGDNDYEDVVFYLTAYPSENLTKPLEVLSPNGGEVIDAGTQNYPIQWFSAEGIDAVKIDYSLDDGSNWTTITNSTPSSRGFDNEYLVNIPKQIYSDQCLVRITEVNNSGTGISDMSNDNFTIFYDYTTKYVDLTNNSGVENGESWETAYTTIQDAIYALTNDPFPDNEQEIWVADGVYYPDDDNVFNAVTDNDRTASFNIPDGVKIYGGFSGRNQLEESAIEDRRLDTYTTTLSGDIDQDEDLSFNSYHVVYFDNVSSSTLLDGFTITAGNANDPLEPVETEDNDGGGIFTKGGAPKIARTKIIGNRCTEDGAAVFGNGSDFILENCLITGNLAEDMDSNDEILSTGGGITNYNANPVIINSTIAGNYATFYGGGIFNFQEATITIDNTIIWNNTSPESNNPSIHNYSGNSSTVITSSDIQGSGGSGDWNSEFGTDNGNNIDTKPYFITPISPDNAPTTAGKYWLDIDYDSPCIGTGTSGTGIPMTDILGHSRPFDVNDNVDMGAYEQHDGDGSLPVELANFKGELINGKIKLTWETHSELNNRGFILERRVNGGDWITIANYLRNHNLVGAGTTSEKTTYIYTDDQIIAGNNYDYQLSDVSEANQTTVHHEVIVSVTYEETEKPVTDFKIAKIFPNPFNPVTTIEYSIPEKQQVMIDVYDTNGNRVQRLLNNRRSRGTHQIQWNAGEYPSGVYFIHLRNGKNVSVQKCILMK